MEFYLVAVSFFQLDGFCHLVWYVGYRVNLSPAECLRSIFQLHNETFNIWSHLIGFIIFTSLFFYTLLALSPYGSDRVRAFEAINLQLREKLETYMPDMEHVADSMAEFR